jgi:2',3'-cyclic-nucleotide 2'-phosphodiesterase (5'-nucleotidase family)
MKNKSLFFVLPLLGISLFLLVTRCTHHGTQPETAQDSLSIDANTLTVLYQSGREGSLEPCGCHSTPYGGIDRELNAVRKFRAENPQLVYVDPGNLFAPLVATQKREAFRKKAPVVVEALNTVGLNAFAPGPNDVSLGLDFLRSMQSNAKFKFVSANIADKKGTLVFEPSTILTAGKWRIGVVGISPTYKFPDGKVLDPIQSLTKAMASLKGKTDVVILLTQMAKHEDNEKLLQKFPQINVLVGLDSNRVLPNAVLAQGNKQLILNQRSQAFYLGRLDLQVASPIQGLYSKKWIELNLSAVDGWKQSLPVVKPERKKELEKLIATYQEQRVLAPVPGGSEFSHTLVALDEATWGQKNELSKIIENQKAAQREEALKQTPQ